MANRCRKRSMTLRSVAIDTASPTGELILNVLGSIAQFERHIMLERHREGIAKAKADKLYKSCQRRPEIGPKPPV
jgi:DNA invertase Pin-like site-specific DNA recombinase